MRHPAMRSKYRNVRTEVDGMRFDSKKESLYYRELKIQQACGTVHYFLRQVPFYLPGGVRYVVDFQVFYANGSVRYIDVKGKETAMFKTKKRMVEALYPIQIECS